MVLPLSGRTELAGDWCTGIGQGLRRDTGTKLPFVHPHLRKAKDIRQPAGVVGVRKT
jgi:hypothetical protein